MVGQIENVENMYECVGIDIELAFHSFLSYASSFSELSVILISAWLSLLARFFLLLLCRLTNGVCCRLHFLFQDPRVGPRVSPPGPPDASAGLDPWSTPAPPNWG